MAGCLPIYDDRSFYWEARSPTRPAVHPPPGLPGAAHSPALPGKRRGADLPHLPALAHAAADTPKCLVHSTGKAGRTGNHLPRDKRQKMRLYFLDPAASIPRQSCSAITVSEISQPLQRPKAKNVTSICDLNHNILH